MRNIGYLFARVSMLFSKIVISNSEPEKVQPIKVDKIKSIENFNPKLHVQSRL
jgi:hypothetical protein